MKSVEIPFYVKKLRDELKVIVAELRAEEPVNDSEIQRLEGIVEELVAMVGDK